MASNVVKTHVVISTTAEDLHIDWHQCNTFYIGFEFVFQEFGNLSNYAYQTTHLKYNLNDCLIDSFIYATAVPTIILRTLRFGTSQTQKIFVEK